MPICLNTGDGNFDHLMLVMTDFSTAKLLFFHYNWVISWEILGGYINILFLSNFHPVVLYLSTILASITYYYDDCQMMIFRTPSFFYIY